ncbi:uncharacterized protein TNCT_411241 [Trichonephila clavata]|uniref:Uncharacterized protein n=1 Tax=Trichonephila clavata TaxID=2740835 RepID=A0A8X6LY24_TRICU|nr:uncharacterized protein TNCT_411241 [Trichonephila clavata]
MSGEVSIPPQLLDFYFTLLGGCNKKREKSMKCARQVHSYSQDVIFAVHNGHVKTPKHIMLDDMIDEVKRLQNCEISSFHIENEDLKELMNNYNIFKQRCFNGEHAQRILGFRSLGIEAEVSDDENIDSDIISDFEAGISYQNKRYKVTFPWKLNVKTLLENNEIARKRFLKN